MLEKVRSSLTYANVMATVAVFLALGGGAYAAVKLPRNSVGASQLKKNAVSSTKVKNGSLKKDDFAKNQLPAGAPGAVGPAGARGATGPIGPTGPGGPGGPPGTFGSVTTVFFQAPADLADNSNMSYGAFCGAGKVAIGGGGRGDDTLSEQTILTNTRPAISSGNTEPPLAGQGFNGWRITVVNPTGGAASGVKPEVWAICVPTP
jgi:hypothetical protein